MVDTTGTVDEEGKPAKPGSSVWFMTETRDRHLVSEYWLSTLGHDIEVEKHFAQINAWKAAPFTTYIVEQKVGDFILIPPLAAHQVWNRGTRTMKVAWNRTTVETLEMALGEALPRARMVCRDEQYKNKAIIYFTLQKYSDLIDKVEALKDVETDQQAILNLDYNTRLRQLAKDFKRLFSLYTKILVSEILAPVSPNEKKGQYLPYDSFVTCAYCRCNIFNRFLTCETCIEPLQNGDENTYDVCMDCFAMGRSCKCISGFKWVEQFPWQELTSRHEQWRHQIIALDGANQNSPRSLQRERKELGKKTLAQVCQEQLKIRPWNDPKNPKPPLTTAEMNSIGVAKSSNTDDDGKVSHKNKKRKLPLDFVHEHVSCYPREAWRCATCAKCERSYQYGSLWRMFELMPQTVMEEYEWECPACRKFCSCGSCRRKEDNTPYEPHGTILGHDTRKVADPRSTESLVDFSMSNLHHIKKTGDDDPLESRRLGRRIDEAARAKAHDLELSDADVDEAETPPVQEQFYQNGIRYTTEAEIPIDPMLSIGQPTLPTTTAPVPTNGSIRNDSDGEHNPQKLLAKKNRQSKPKVVQDKSHQRHTGAKSVHGSGVALRPPSNVAPTAQMTLHPSNRMDNASTYESDEPFAKGLTSTSASSLPANVQMFQNGQPTQNGQLSQYQQAQVDKSLLEAKSNNRFIIAEAAHSGKRLPITLHVGRLGMALIADRLSNGSSVNVDNRQQADKELLFSDVPAVDRPQKAASTMKKRKTRNEESDEDFSTRKRRNRKKYVAQSTSNDRHHQAKARLDQSDYSSESETPGGTFIAVNKPPGPRRLPKYLAEQHEDGDQPAELPPEVPRRRSLHDSKAGSSLLKDALSSRKSTNNGINAQRKIADENRKAKQKAVQWADDDEEDGTSSSGDNGLKHAPAITSISAKAKNTLMKIPQSMFSRMAGRKFKVAGAKPK
ncbi:uncharacterized protein KY384_007030 [Bacidia gigantensis]|uniref:uncharacterized protein n=1 Tax=Bacidia gigantensis TaxID=2732470 RepID=UPI001D038C2B|nr:uncharacterized protein KY384_007030 [Bacidia gigantensis]KAG8528114.1 hypothetical protein KY384_007030 [Bacidia gigantensis]